MTGSGLQYLIKEGFHNIKANRQMSLASIGVLVACMLLIGASVLFTLNINAVMGYIESQNEMVIFVEDNAGPATVEQLGEALKKNSNIISCRFVSQEEGLHSMMGQMSDSSYLLDGLLDDNPLPASYVVKLSDLSVLAETVEEVQGMTGVQSISAPTDVAATLTDISTGVSVAGTFIVTILGMVSIIIISNTIKVTIFNRRREINIMKYVGATDTFIRLPFMIEGMMIGLISALLSFGVLWVGYEYIMEWIGGTSSSWLQLAYVNLVTFTDIAPVMLGGFATAGIGFGMLGSMFFVGRYLKV
ncbi:MAG: permease-like cell division protein FtsX [Angelakisella sp.]|nr:permease-like cell division protein FtsX [Angelakisella sp.]